MPDGASISRDWLSRHPVEVAWELIGCVLSLERDGSVVSGRIVETEAYAGPRDPASHASRLAVARKVMAGPPGTVYTYLSYGIHRMMNIVAHAEGEAGGILVRALEPLDGMDLMRERRNGVPDIRLAQGPGSVGQALGIQLSDLGTDLLTAPEWSLYHGRPRDAVVAGPRIGISKAVEAPWRFFEAGNPNVSRHRQGRPVERHELPSLVIAGGSAID